MTPLVISTMPSMLVFLAVLLLPQSEATPQSPGDRSPQRSEEIVVTGTGFAEDRLYLPQSVDSLGSDWLRQRSRSLPEALRGQPSAMVQKTASGQSSPFLRGFTGFRTRLLVDGIPLNHAAMREGPNQYWSTVDSLKVERLELVRGPSSVLYGSDAIGGTVNAVARRAAVGGTGFHIGGASYTRFSTAESSWTERLETSMNQGSEWGLLGGVTMSRFGDLRAGSGELPETGYHEGGADVRFDRYWNNGVVWTFSGETFRQANVPRTHKTVFAVPYQGTSIGNELRRDQDQIRDLLFSRVSWDRQGGLWNKGEVTLSYQRHAEDRDRLRSGARRDLQGFELLDWGLTARFESEPTKTGIWSWGAELHDQSADSFRHNFVAGSYTGSAVQGAIGDDSSYRSMEVYAQNEILLGKDFSLIPGVRLSSFSLDADRVANPVAGPTVISLSDDWTNLAASLRGVWYLSEENTLYGGLSQGFRAPNLSDLTALDATSAVETPTPGLDPEHYLQAELGSKGRGGSFSWQASAYHTVIQDMIVQSPTGVLIGGTPEVQKSNVGDGWLQGVEFAGNYQINPQWSVFLSASWMNGEVDQIALPAGTSMREPVSRLMPFQASTGVRWSSEDQRFWAEAWTWTMDNQDKLALRDVTDTSRIPVGGTPGFTILGLSAGLKIHPQVDWSVSLENLGDKNYRVHGSGIHGPGLNAITTVEVHF